MLYGYVSHPRSNCRSANASVAILRLIRLDVIFVNASTLQAFSVFGKWRRDLGHLQMTTHSLYVKHSLQAADVAWNKPDCIEPQQGCPPAVQFVHVQHGGPCFAAASRHLQHNITATAVTWCQASEASEPYTLNISSLFAESMIRRIDYHGRQSIDSRLPSTTHVVVRGINAVGAFDLRSALIVRLFALRVVSRCFPSASRQDYNYLSFSIFVRSTQWTIKTWHFIFDYNFG